MIVRHACLGAGEGAQVGFPAALRSAAIAGAAAAAAAPADDAIDLTGSDDEARRHASAPARPSQVVSEVGVSHL